ncbi:MAG: HesA/MoeB/ThiF family protein [Desulfarculus sp.]|nr:HesA/MoeB/ThiF family protein [Desulfarculus sp.]
MEGRYQMQERFGPWGRSGQERLRQGRALVVGLGGLGGTAAMLLARAGVGSLRLADPDHPSLDNLHRQVLYNEQDVAAGRSKAQAAESYLRSLNSQIAIEAHQVALGPGNALELVAGCQVVLDGLDNASGRHLLNEACLKLGIPLVHAGVVQAKGQLVVVRPGQGPCLRCWFPSRREPPAGSAQLGIIGPAAACLASLQAAEALKIMLGAQDQILEGMLSLNLWPLRIKRVEHRNWDRMACPACRGQYELLP